MESHRKANGGLETHPTEEKMAQAGLFNNKNVNKNEKFTRDGLEKSVKCE